MKKNNKIEVIDNYLDESQFKTIQAIMMENGRIPWYYSDTVNTKNDNLDDNYQFTHIFYKDHAPKGVGYEVIYPLVKKIHPIAILRIKANLLTKTSEHIEHGFHIDVPYLKKNQKSTTAIFYINSNNGYTKFEDGTIVNSVENRMAIFDSRLQHTGSTCTDQKIRVVINFNFI